MRANEKPSILRNWVRPSAGVGALTLGLLLFAGWADSPRSGKLDQFARCLTEKRTVMYGSFLCPHCQDQKQLFGDSFAYVQYVECSSPGKRQINPECASAKIQHVPTWVFGDGQRREGMTTLKELSDRTGCKLP
jgi:hypothetical protein